MRHLLDALSRIQDALDDLGYGVAYATMTDEQKAEIEAVQSDLGNVFDDLDEAINDIRED